MEKIRDIRIFFARHGKLLFESVIVIAFILFFINAVSKYLNDENNNNKDSKQNNYIVSANKREIDAKDTSENKKIISTFIELCINGKVEQAYEMISIDCRTEKYSTVEKFKENYINKIFNIKINYDISEINKSYKIIFKPDALQSGKIGKDTQIEDYYKIEETVLAEKSIYINLYNNI